jgi:hypothetical protein
MIYIKTCLELYEKQTLYSLESLLRTIGFDYKIYSNEELNENDILITYGKESFKKEIYSQIIIKNYHKLFKDGYKTKDSLPKKVYKAKELVSFFSNDIDYNYDVIDNLILVNFDIVSDTFFLLSRYEEYVIGNNLENHNRFSIEDSILFKESLLDRPIVNEYSIFLKKLILKLNPKINILDKFFEKGKIFISHDIDSISKYNDKFYRKLASSIIREKNIKKSLSLIGGNFKYILNPKNDPYWKFEYFLELEKKYGFRASYYFMSGGETTKDNNYSIKNKKLKRIFNELKEYKNEIGIHGSYNSYNNENVLKHEVDKLENEVNMKIYGIRQHFLRFNIKETWRIHKELGLKYDSTVGYAENIGFRCGTCSQFKIYDLNEEQELDYWEIPLIIMDTTLNSYSYMGMDIDLAIEKCKEIYDIVKKYNGVFALLWHNSSLDSNSNWCGWEKVYEEILKYAHLENSIGLSGIDIVNLVEKYY